MLYLTYDELAGVEVPVNDETMDAGVVDVVGVAADAVEAGVDVGVGEVDGGDGVVGVRH